MVVYILIRTMPSQHSVSLKEGSKIKDFSIY